MSKLAALLGGMTLNDLAKEVLSLQGRRGDTELAHVNKREAALLKSQGGSGTINSNTGMPEFYDDYEGYDYPMDMGGGFDSQQVIDATVPESYQGAVDYFGGQPTPSYGGGESYTTPQEFSSFAGAYPETDPYSFAQPSFTGAYPETDIYSSRTGYPDGLTYDPGAGYGAGTLPGTRGTEDVLGFTQGVGITGEGAPATKEEPGLLDKAEKFAKDYPGLVRAGTAALLGAPAMRRAAQARGGARATGSQIKKLGEPIRKVGEQLLGAGQRGELTAPQQQQLQIASAAAKQDLTRRGVTSGTAAQMAQNRIEELKQRFVQNNIDNGVRLINAANSYDIQAIKMAYQMNKDADTMTQDYFTNMMRAFGAIPAGA